MLPCIGGTMRYGMVRKGTRMSETKMRSRGLSHQLEVEDGGGEGEEGGVEAVEHSAVPG